VVVVAVLAITNKAVREELVLELAQTGRTSVNPVRLMPDLKRGETA
jgi:hypothetical protein